VLLGLLYGSVMYFYTIFQTGLILGRYTIFVEMEEQVKTSKTVQCAVGSMEYAFYYYVEMDVTKYSYCDLLLETLRRDSIQRMVSTMQDRFPESNQGEAPASWMEVYGDKLKIDETKETVWYKKWYMPSNNLCED
jgi:hypothetical protein